jgi:hypothetical protein
MAREASSKADVEFLLNEFATFCLECLGDKNYDESGPLVRFYFVQERNM